MGEAGRSTTGQDTSVRIEVAKRGRGGQASLGEKEEVKREEGEGTGREEESLETSHCVTGECSPSHLPPESV